MKRYSLILATLFLAVLFFKLWLNYSDRFAETEQYYNKTAVNLGKGTDKNDISSVLTVHDYFSEEDAMFVSEFITQKFSEGKKLSTLYDLNKRVWQIPSSRIDSIAGVKKTHSVFVQKLKDSREKNLGFDADFNQIELKNLESEATIDTTSSDVGVIKVTVVRKLDRDSVGFIKRLRGKDEIPCEGVVVRLSEQYIDTLNTSKRRMIRYLVTDDEGQCVFKGLNPKLSYSVLPIREGFEYGTSKGTIGGNLSFAIDNQRSLKDKIFGWNENTLICSFTQQEHKMPIFDAATLKQIKDDRILTVRSPKEFKSDLTLYVVLFFAVWWGLWQFCQFKNKPINTTIVSILMLLTGLCLLTMFSLNDPLMDKLLGVHMAQGIIVGVVLIIVLQNINFQKLYQNRSPIGFDVPLECVKWIFKPFKVKVSYLTRVLSDSSKNVIWKLLSLLLIVVCLPMLFLDLFKITTIDNVVCKKLDRLPKGCGYLLFALFLTALLWTPLGVSVGGMRVNLNFGILFQPSEIAKFLAVFFMAAYFSSNADRIVKYSEKGNTGLFAAKLKMMLSIFLGLGFLLGLYLVLGDMGPAIVLAFTFIMLYSIIKSKVDLTGLSEENRLKRIFTCDVAMLIYGILSFILCLWIGKVLGNMGIFCILWFVVWIITGIMKQQIYETPVFFNFIVAAFIFGGNVLSRIPELDSVVDRLEIRNEMCTNTWGTLPIDGRKADAGKKTQVAEGLWGLASGGFWGQGLGNGSPHFIPAFHTDLILESMGEQMGFVGVFIVLLLLALLLRKTVVLGYRTSHPFTFYLCLGIAIVTAVQFIIISLGSTGMIPLTGVTVPFLSYGMVSMILNLVAYGIILSIDSHTESESASANQTVQNLARQNIGKYNYSVSLLSWIYCILAVFICGVFFYYQIIDRNHTLIREVYVNNSSGVPVVEYNPRIAQLTDKMQPGDIYDRNGLLLATSEPSNFLKKFDAESTERKKKTYADKYTDIFGKEYKLDTLKRRKRYYPFGEHLAFMLGDNAIDALYTFRDENSGYMAEWRHLSALIGYDNLLDENGGTKPEVTLESDSCIIDKWHSEKAYYKETKQLRNYSALIPYLKKGVNSNKVARYNKRKTITIKPRDIYLTIDAVLQTELQKRLSDEYKNTRLNRVSVVIVDGKEGDLLASANYPLPDSDRLRSEIVNDKIPPYRDAGRPRNWRAYTDVDLGLVYATAPGSSAKVMSAIAAFQKMGTQANKAYDIKREEVIANYERNLNLYGTDKDMMWAIKESSNAYFVKLVNDNDLYDNLADIYRNVGIQIATPGVVTSTIKPYVFNYADSMNVSKFYRIFESNRPEKAVDIYRDYVSKGHPQILQNEEAPIWQWAYGQGTLDATPISMARVASIVANDGELSITRFTLDEPVQKVKVMGKRESAMLRNFMTNEANKHNFGFASEIGGKTGTPQRNFGKARSYDGWYICYVKPPQGSQNKTLGIAVRIERNSDSKDAWKLVKDIVLATLEDLKYIN